MAVRRVAGVGALPEFWCFRVRTAFVFGVKGLWVKGFRGYGLYTSDGTYANPCGFEVCAGPRVLELSNAFELFESLECY